MCARTSQAQQRGIALVSVLWIVALLSVLAGIVAARTRDETWMTRNQLDMARARYAAEAGFSLAVMELMDGLSRKSPPEMRIRNRSQEDIRVLTRTSNESGRIDLNSAGDKLLAMLFESADPGAPSQPRVDAVADWRDDDDKQRPSGAEDMDYRARGLAYGSRDGAFRAVDELALVLGISAELAYRIEPMLTLHSGSPGVNPDLATDEVLAVLMGGDKDMARSLANARQDGQQLNRMPALQQRTGGLLSSDQSRFYRVEVQAGSNSAARARLTAVLEIDPRSRLPRIVEWRWRGPDLGLDEAEPNSES